ncbi:MAG TPA: hypothetical protein EYP29_00640, partial [Thermoplasmata archaeon]|nr:hypothetical protein [Thermoplasmata archaeon]
MTNKDAKVFSRFALFVVAVLLFSSFSAFVSNKAQAEGGGNYPAPADGDWIITNETYVYNETIVLNGNLTIENGGKLTLRGVVLKMNVAKDGQYRIEVKSGGELHILDWDNNPWTKGDRTIITDGDNDDDSAPYNDQEDTNARYYIVVRNGAVFELKNSEVSEAGYLWGEVSGIYLDGRADYIIENNTIKNCYRGLNLFYSYNKVIRGNIFKECDAQGIIMYSSTGNLLENNVFENTPQGLYLYRDAWDNIIRNNTFRWNTQGIYLRHVNTYNNTFINNTVEYNSYGVFVVTDAHHNILINSTITGNSYYDVYLDEGTNLTLLNTDYDSYYVSGGAYLTEMEYINIEVEDLRGDGIKGVDVKAISREINVKSEEDNLASPRHGTKATANSQYNWRFLAGRVQDGKGEDGTNQEYYWLTKDHPPAGTYLMLDFTKPHRFNKVRLLNTRNAGNYDRSTKDFHLAVSKDGVNFQSIYNGTLTENDITNWYEAEFEPVEARYLRFYVDSYYGVGAGLAEIEVYNTGKVKKPFDFEMYATSGFGGKQKKTNAKGEVVAIPVIEKRFYSNNVPQYFATDIQVSYHGWNDKKIGLNVTSETTLNFVKDVLTVGPSKKDFSSIQEAVDHAQEEKKIVVFP